LLFCVVVVVVVVVVVCSCYSFDLNRSINSKLAATAPSQQHDPFRTEIISENVSASVLLTMSHRQEFSMVLSQFLQARYFSYVACHNCQSPRSDSNLGLAEYEEAGMLMTASEPSIFVGRSP
jgi:hypothetical protein